jgi:hypothetical protein
MVVDGFRSTMGEGEKVGQSRELKINFSSLLCFPPKILFGFSYFTAGELNN